MSMAAGACGVLCAAVVLASSAPVQAAPTAAQSQALSSLQHSAASEINRRLNMLSGATTLLSNATKLPEKVITNVKDEVKTQDQVLVGYNKKIMAETDFPKAQKEVQKVEDEYPSYALASEKGYLLGTADFQESLEAKLTVLASKFDTRLQAANNVGKDITSAQITLNDMNSHVNTAQGFTKDVAKEVPPIKLSDYEAHRSVLDSYYKELVAANNEEHKAFDDAKNLVVAVENL
jgi:hypothetical protein